MSDAAYFVLRIAKVRLLIDAVEGHNGDDNAILTEAVQMLEDIERELATPSGV